MKFADAPHAGAAAGLLLALRFFFFLGGVGSGRSIWTPGHSLSQVLLEDLGIEGGIGETDPVQVISTGVGFVIPAFPFAVLHRHPVALHLLDYAVADDHNLVGSERGENLRAAGGEDFRVRKVILGEFLWRTARTRSPVFSAYGIGVVSASQPKNLTEPFFLLISGAKRKSGKLFVRTSPTFSDQVVCCSPETVPYVAVALHRDLHGSLPFFVAEVPLSFEMVLEVRQASVPLPGPALLFPLRASPASR